MPSLVLYQSGSGSEQFKLTERISPARFDVAKQFVLRHMREKFLLVEAIKFFEQMPWELWNSTNDFGDEFLMLYTKISMETLAEIKNGAEKWRHRIRDGCPIIAGELDRLDLPIRFIAVGFDIDAEIADIPSPKVVTTSAVVEDALAQAETLIGQHGAGSGLDRVHTAFHAYLESMCQPIGPGIANDVAITALFSYLRQYHPALAITDAEEKETLDKIFRGMSKIIDTLNHLRNEKSLAHPNSVLDDPEAMLMINLVRTMLRYLDMRLR